MPNYITGGLAEFADPPYAFDNLISTSFILDANGQKLQTVCDNFLNTPLGRGAAAGFIPNGSNKVVMVCNTFPIATANPSLPIGYSTYCEIALMFSVFDQTSLQWSWYVPVLYIDGPKSNVEEWQAELPLSLGREVYGLAKARAEIDFETTYYTGSLKTIDPASAGNPLTITEAIKISVGDCVALQVEADLATTEGELLAYPFDPPSKEARRKSAKAGTEVAKRKAEAKRSAEVAKHRAKAAELRAEVARLKARRDDAREGISRAKRELARFNEAPWAALWPKDLIQMLWDGKPYELIGREPPQDEETLYRNLGFIRKAPRRAQRSKRKVRRRVMAPRIATASDAQPALAAEYEWDFRLLGLRQLHDPDPPKYAQADIQQVFRTQLLFDPLPLSPLQSYCVEVKAPAITGLLGIAAQNPLLPDRVYVNKYAHADFGKIAQPVL
jgi:hypothetical protein